MQITCFCVPFFNLLTLSTSQRLGRAVVRPRQQRGRAAQPRCTGRTCTSEEERVYWTHSLLRQPPLQIWRCFRQTHQTAPQIQAWPFLWMTRLGPGPILTWTWTWCGWWSVPPSPWTSVGSAASSESSSRSGPWTLKYNKNSESSDSNRL